MEHALEKIGRLLEAAGTDYGRFPPTLLFEEGWMLRLVLDGSVAKSGYLVTCLRDLPRGVEA